MITGVAASFEGLIKHGPTNQYTSAQFAYVDRDLGAKLSVGRTGQCWSNALAESFFATIKGEMLEHRS